MKKFGFITNKYTVSVLILLCLLLADIALHRSISRVILPSSFSDKIKPVSLPVCSKTIIEKDKHWIQAVNNIPLLEKLPANTPGIECDLVFNMLRNHFEIYPDSNVSFIPSADSLLTVYGNKNFQANTWFDIKNLTNENTEQAVKEMLRLSTQHGLTNKIIIESSSARFLKAFCDSGFFTGYTVPDFNPYNATEEQIVRFADSIRNNLSKYPASAVTCYYYQYPVLKKFFPNYPILTRADNTAVSVVSYIFKRQLDNDEHIKVILQPFKD